MKKIVLMMILITDIVLAQGQQAVNIEKISEDKWQATIPITPRGQSGPHITNLKVTIDLILSNSSSQSGADAVMVGIRFSTGGVSKYRYQGVDYDVNKDLGGVGYTGFREFNYRISIANAGSISSSSDAVTKISLGKKLDYKEAEVLRTKLVVTSFEITGYELIKSDLDDVARRIGSKKQVVQGTPPVGQSETVSRSGTDIPNHPSNIANTNSTEATTEVDIVEAAQAYNAAEKEKSNVLSNAADQTFSQWKQGNYIKGATPLANEFARQGSAAGAYGTVGVAVAAEIGSAIADARAARKAREASEAAYNYEVEQGYKSLTKDAYADALRWYYSSYQQQKNTLKSATHVGFMLMRGMGTQTNYSEALKFLNEATEGYRSNTKDGGAAYFFLSKMYGEGLGVSKDPYKAFQLMEEAAKRDKSFMVHYGYNGIEEAYYSLAFFHLTGIGTSQNFQKAYDMFVAMMGSDDNFELKHEANLAIGIIYYYGLGLKKDVKKAIDYFKIASDDGNSNALAMIKKICDNQEVKGTKLEDLQKVYAKASSKKYVNRTTNNTFGKFLKLN